MEKKDPCWDGYKMVGTKKKDGKTVPNCVPDEPKKTKKKVLLESIAQLKRAIKIPANPLFHVTGNAAVQILRGSGLEAQSAGESRFGGTQYDISMTRNLNWALNASRKGFGRTILVFDRNEIQSKFKMEARNYQGYKQQNDSEFEERILTKKIPKQMIKGIIINDESEWMEKEWAGWPKHFGLKMFMVHYTGGKYKVLADPTKTKSSRMTESSETTSASIPVRNMPAAGEEKPRRRKRKTQHIEEMSSPHLKMRKLAREAHKKGKRYFTTSFTSEKQDIYDWIPDLLGPKPKKGMMGALKGLFETSEASLLAAFVEAGEEILQERKLSDSENKFKKEHVEKLKKHKSNFTDRYGKDGESVMWGVATNLAKKKAK